MSHPVCGPARPCGPASRLVVPGSCQAPTRRALDVSEVRRSDLMAPIYPDPRSPRDEIEAPDPTELPIG